MVDRNRRIVHLHRMNHGKRLHRVFTLNMTGSKITGHKSGFLVPTFMDTGEGKIDSDLWRGDEGEVGALDPPDRVKLIEMSVPSRIAFRAFNL